MAIVVAAAWIVFTKVTSGAGWAVESTHVQRGYRASRRNMTFSAYVFRASVRELPRSSSRAGSCPPRPSWANPGRARHHGLRSRGWGRIYGGRAALGAALGAVLIAFISNSMNMMYVEYYTTLPKAQDHRRDCPGHIEKTLECWVWQRLPTNDWGRKHFPGVMLKNVDFEAYVGEAMASLEPTASARAHERVGWRDQQRRG